MYCEAHSHGTFHLGSVRGALPESEDESDGLCNMPDEFDWQTYLLYHPDIRDTGIVDEGRAKEHYCRYGKKKKLLYKRVDVTMRYTACTGKSMDKIHGYMTASTANLNLLYYLAKLRKTSCKLSKHYMHRHNAPCIALLCEEKKLLLTVSKMFH